MEPGRWGRITDIYHATIARPQAERASFLGEECHGDESLRKQVEAMVKSHERSGNFIESPAFADAPELLIDEPTRDLIGQSIGHYRIESLLGVGGMGEVYLARDELLGRKVALKFLPEHLTAEATQLSRFKTEARTASALNHPNILTVHEIGAEGNRHFIATEFIEGITLRALLARGRMNLHDALEIAVQVASALAAAHETGVVHRDIKPENIMLRPDGYAKVLDFGIAKLTEQHPGSSPHEIGTTTLQTQPGLVLGTAHYMSPEQTRGQKADVRSDIWSLGVLVYEMVGGVPPFSGETPSDCIASILTREPPPLSGVSPNVPLKLQSIVQKALRKNSDERYQTIDEMLADLRRLKEVSESITSGWKRQKKITVLLAASVAVALVIAGLFIYVRPTRTVTNTLAGNASPLGSVIPEKSIAVLPFSNLSKEEENAFFADGVQDEILTNLARIGDLKVISRASVMQYNSRVARNLGKVGQQLGVAHVVEGSVQRAGNRVRVNAQLVDARIDRQLWGQTYDRELADVFAIQSEIAKAIAEQLQAKLSPAEKTAIEKPPTTDLTAFDLYTRAKTLLLTTSFISSGDQNLRQAVEFLNHAVQRDPAFFEAYYQLVFVHGRLYSLGFDHTANRLASAEAALQAAIRLRPDAGETHLARASYLYYGPRDYAGALAELENARRSLPNDPRLSELTGYILRRRGQQEEGLRNLEKAIELDPRNYFIMQQIALSYQFLRRYPEEAAILDRALTIVPKDAGTKVNRALVDFYWKADTKPLHQAIDSILAGDPGAISVAADSWLVCALAEHDRVAAERALVALGDDPWWVDAAVILSRSFGEGLLARVMKDEAKARAAFSKARAEQEKIVQAQPDYGPALCVLGLIDAALGRKEAAFEEARRAIELLPVEKDSVNGSRMLVYFAIIAAWTGEKDLALQQLELGARAPTPSQALNYGALKLLPFWDPLRGDPRFEKIVASLGPKEAKPLSESHTSPSQAPAQSPTEKSIAVLPFADLSQARDQEYFCDGIQEEILTRLSKIADLKVISRTSTQRFKSAPKNLPEIARQLGVASILEGTVQKAEGQVRVNVQLINARNDSHLWAEKYDRKLTDVFGVESEIAKAIADTLQARLTGAEEHALSSRPTENPEAHQLYLKGRYFWNRRTSTNLKKAIEYFQQAIDKDPGYALAYAGLSDAYVLLPAYAATPPRDEVPKAMAAAKKALQLDDTLAEAHASFANALVEDMQFDQSIKEFQRAIELNPNYATAHHWYAAGPLTFLGRFEEALAEARRAQALDPLSVIINADLGRVLLSAGRYDEAIAQLRQAIELEPGFYYVHWNLGRALEGKGSLREATAEYRKAAEFDPVPVVLGSLGHAYAVSGHKDEARKILDELTAAAQQRYVPAIAFSFIYVGLGDTEQALRFLEKSYDDRAAFDLQALMDDRSLDPLRGHPRFERLVAKVLGSAENKSLAQPIESKSIAVLPFENLSSEPETAYFADGIQEEILTRLSKIADLKVISRTSTQRFKSVPKNLPEIAKQLGVAHILEGTVQKSADQVRVNVQLINAQNDSHLWADKYDRKLTDIFAIESEIAGKIADTLQAKLSSAAQKVLNARPTESTEAHQLYLRGRYVMEKRTPADLNKAADYFNQAITQDPNYAAAYAGLADCYVLLPQWKQGPVAEYLSKARAAANKALQIDGNLADAHVSLGTVAFGEKLDLREAKREFERAIQLNPNYALAHYCLGYDVLLALGNHDQAIAALKRAIELDPVSSVINTNLGCAYILARRYPEAIVQLRKTIELNPGFAYAHAILGEALELNGQLDDAFTEYEKSYNAGHDFRGLMMMAHVHGLKGDRAKALQLLEQAKQLNSPDIWAFGCAMVYVGLGDRNQTLDWLEQSYRQREFINLSTIKDDPLFDPLRSEPRFQQLVAKLFSTDDQ
jgi:non-specific serine/threonine protein kinase